MTGSLGEARPMAASAHRKAGLSRYTGLSVALLFPVLEKIKDAHTQCVRDNLDGVQGGISLAVLDATQVRLIKTAFFSKLDLTHPCSQTEFAHTRTKLFSQGVFHPSTMLFML